MKPMALTFLTLIGTLALALPSLAVDQTEFDRILGLKMSELTQETEALLEQKYPEEDWEAHDFPNYVFTSEPVEMGYRIAVKEPELLRRVPCYCFCEAMGHRNLLHCFLKEGETGGGFDDHAVTCNICFGQAMLAFLWQDAGASEEEILQGMEKKFERLIRETGGPRRIRGISGSHLPYFLG